MTKNIDPKTWQRPSQGGFRYSSPPQDVTAPTPAVLSPPVPLSQSALRTPIATAAVDYQSGVMEYIPHYSTDVNGPYTTGPAIARDVAETIGIDISGLSAGTEYFLYVTARDLALNESAASNVVSATTQAAAANASIFPNWPSMSCSVQQGDIFGGVASSNTQYHTDILEKDIIGPVQWMFPTNARLASRNAAMATYLNQPNQRTKFLLYTNLQENTKLLPTDSGGSQNDPLEISRDIIAGTRGSQSGNSNWYLHPTGSPSTKVSYVFQNGLHWQLNNAFIYAGKNNRGEDFDQCFVRAVDEAFNGGTPANWIDTYFHGVFCDAYEQMPQASTEGFSNYDMDGNGVTDNRLDFSSASTAGGRKYAESMARYPSTWKARKGSNWIVMGNTARSSYDYRNAATRASMKYPLSSHPEFRTLDLNLAESAGTFELGFTGNYSATNSATWAYTKHNAVAPVTCFWNLALQEIFIKADGDTTDACGGRHATVVSQQSFDRDPTLEDIRMARFMLGIVLLIERAAFGVNIRGKRAFHLDEEHFQLGNPRGTRSMGTLSNTTGSFSMKAPTVTVGSDGLFYIQEYDYGAVIVNLAVPPTGSRLFNNSLTPVVCPLPSTDTWAALQGSSYENPITGVSMRNQDPTVNNGAALTSVSLRPYEMQMVRRT